MGVVVGRLPGQLNGWQFHIQDCRECDIFVLDHTSALTVHGCTDCKMVLGPCGGRYVHMCVCVCVCVCPANGSQVGNDDVCFVGKHQFVHIGMVSQSFTHEGDCKERSAGTGPPPETTANRNNAIFMVSSQRLC